MPFGAWTVEPSIGMHYRSGGLGTYLYGIEAGDDGDPFRIDPHIVPFATLTAGFELSDHWTLLVGLSGEYLPDAVTDCPLVDDSYTATSVLGITYTS